MSNLKSPIISWYIKPSYTDEYKNDSNYYIGSYDTQNAINFKMQVWNNRGGTEAVQDLDSFLITIEFANFEDAEFLQYISVYINDQQQELAVTDQSITITCNNFHLRGTINDGSDSDNNNVDNHITVSVSIAPPANANIKMNDIKEMLFNIIAI